MASTSLNSWTVDYGSGPQPVLVPHAWASDVDVRWEGPARYAALVEVPAGAHVLRFFGVSYEARVSIDGKLAVEHRGMWDAFDVPIEPGTHDVLVEVVKSGGGRFPVREVAGGFLPFVYHTFGGIHGRVELRRSDEPHRWDFLPTGRARVDGSRVFVDGEPFFARGTLHWGWYPELGHPTPDLATIEKEIATAKSLGFNLVKFCLWIPPHEYLEALAESGMFAWIELPLWDPTPEPARQDEMAQEIERVVRQYRGHDNVLFWTVGCELGKNVTPETRAQLTQLVANLTGSPLVKDNSGGSEMYGSDLREYGTFQDFHPYCDPAFYGPVLDSLLPAARPTQPLLLGEFNDSDVHRDVARLGDEYPFWASFLPELNDQGVRWQFDLPRIVAESRFSSEPSKSGHRELMRSSREQSLFIRKHAVEQARARGPISGYVITGWRDTPVSTAGFVDDWGEPRFSPRECASWNGEDCLFIIPNRHPSWTHGGNRPGYADSFNHFEGTVFLRIGCHSERGRRAGLVWKLRGEDGMTVAQGTSEWAEVAPMIPGEVGQVVFEAKAGSYRLEVEFGNASNEWPIWVVSPATEATLAGWTKADPDSLLGDLTLAEVQEHGGPTISTSDEVPSGPAVWLLHRRGTLPMPFFREAAYEFSNPEFWSQVPFQDRWTRLLAIGGDRAIDPAFLESLGGGFEILLNRVDTRTYQDSPVLARRGDLIVTSLRPHGGLGCQPTSVRRNPAGIELLRTLAAVISDAGRGTGSGE